MRLCLILLFCLFALPAEAETRTLRHDGIERHYIVDRPRESRATPALIVLHGGGGRAAQVRRHARFRLDRSGWTVVYPDGIAKRWDDGRLTADGRPLATADDAGFLAALIGALAARGEIDPERVFFAGISNGGAMSLRMACERPGLAAGIAVVAMTIPEGVPCPPRWPVPAIFILGDADPLVPFAGGPITLGRRDRGRVLSAEATFDAFLRANRCSGEATRSLPDRDPADGITVEATDGRGCAAPLRQIVAHGGGHTWPGARRMPLLEKVVGPTARDFSATAEIERFFTALARH